MLYKYATSFCAAVTLSPRDSRRRQGEAGGLSPVPDAGGSMAPDRGELKVGGVDMSTPKPVCDALDYFAELVMQYQNLLSEEG